MEVVIDKENRIAEIWVKSVESGKESVEEEINNLVAAFTLAKLKTVIIRSEKEDLSKCMENLIRSNMYEFAKEKIKESKKEDCKNEP
ncbi:MAG: hypothetical protein LUI12_03485 [Clostridiales bacterium]|nr:hypothetical protein [Clostridiales bacterium]